MKKVLSKTIEENVPKSIDLPLNIWYYKSNKRN